MLLQDICSIIVFERLLDDSPVVGQWHKMKVTIATSAGTIERHIRLHAKDEDAAIARVRDHFAGHDIVDIQYYGAE